MAWPGAQVSDAVALLARHCRLSTAASLPESLTTPLSTDDPAMIDRCVAATAGCLGLEAQPVNAFYPTVDNLLANCGPALIGLPGETGPRFVALVRRHRCRLEVLTPEGAVISVRAEVLRDALCQEHEQKVEPRIAPLISVAKLSPKSSPRVRKALCAELLAHERVSRCWLLRPTGGSPLGGQFREAGLRRLAWLFLGAHFAAYLMLLLSWWVLGKGALQGRLDLGWMQAWQLLLLTAIPFRLISSWARGQLSIQTGAFFKRRLLAGTLQLEGDEVRHLGYGHMLGRVFEAELVEFAALSGGLLALSGLLDLILVGFVLSLGPAAWFHMPLFVAWGAVTSFLAVRVYRRERRWTLERLELTHNMVELMIGHRTRVAQLPRALWNADEDQSLERYLQCSAEYDRAHVWLEVLVPSGWLILALVVMVPAFVTGGSGAVPLAIGVGGVVMAQRTFKSLVGSFRQLGAAVIAWDRIGLFWEASQNGRGIPTIVIVPVVASETSDSPAPPLLDGRDLVFRYQDRAEPVLSGTSLKIFPGARVLLKGHSGSGKSTLSVLLAGVRKPHAGLLLLNGLDRDTLGLDEWRRRVSLAPQFHDNHVFAGTFAFNALLGRNWPAEPEELEEAERISRALGLGPLLDRMPAGLQQMVGETGWQLSHGEKSRLYIARAILQRTDVLILDESLAALDPESLARALALILQEAKTIIVVAHP
jgi:ATP-binding cassette subfamily B protein